MGYSVGGSSQPSGSSPNDLALDLEELQVLEQDAMEARASCADDSGEDEPIGAESTDENGVVKLVYEKTGVSHLVHCWFAQAHNVRK